MIRRALVRVMWGFVVMWAVMTIAFLVNEVLPSDPARMIAGPAARPADVAKIRAQLGLDRPVVERYGGFVRRLVHLAPRAEDDAKAHATCADFGPVHFDLGKSYLQRRAVTTIVGERLPRSGMLALSAIVVQIALGLGLGVAAAAKRGTRWDTALIAASLVGVSAPTFVVGLMLQFFLAQKLNLLPLDGYGKTTAEQARAIVLPAITLGLAGAAYYARLVRGEVAEALAQDFARTARAKGASRVAVVLRHALRSAFAPIVTVVGLDLGALVGGAVVTETLFRWPGLGAASVTAMLDRDAPLVLGTVLVSSAAIVLSSVLVDVAITVLDPRARRASPH